MEVLSRAVDGLQQTTGLKDTDRCKIGTSLRISASYGLFYFDIIENVPGTQAHTFFQLKFFQLKKK